MALVDNAWYVNFGNGSSTGYYAVTAWAVATSVAVGALRRQLATPAVGSERVFVCIVAGITHPTTEPTWVITRGGKTTDNTATWQECTGIAALNGDATNTPSWTITATPPGGVKNTAVTLGQVIKRDSGASYQICTTAGTAGNGAEPAFSNTAGTTTTDNTVTWTSLGAVGNFTGWQAPHARLTNAMTATWGQNGNSFFVASAHKETQATSITIPSIGAVNAPALIYCVNAAGSVPPVAADLVSDPQTVTTPACATITTTGSSNITIFSGGTPFAYFYGIVFNAGTGAVSNGISVSPTSIFENCSFRKLGTTNSTTAIQITSPSTVITNCTMQFGSTNDGLRLGGVWKNTSTAIIGSTFPTTLLNTNNGYYCVGVDLSALGSSNIMGTTFGTLINCKLGASAVIASTPTTFTFIPGNSAKLINSDNAATNYRSEQYLYQGTQTTETTIVRTGGATDDVTPISWKIINTANAKWIAPFEAQPITIWNESTAAITTLTIYGTTSGGGVPNNDDIWVEVEYLGSSASPKGSFIATTKASNLSVSATTNNSSDASTWGGAGAGNGFKMVVPSFTPGMKGPINITVKSAKASATYYIDPKVSI